jgi:LmbE family N-acetylglucosaminyl deacetylase
MPESVMVIAPHPDDEAIGCGGAILLHRLRGDPVHVVFLTSGELGIDAMPAQDVIAVREAEAREAAAILDVGAPTFLRLPDQGVAAAAERAGELVADLLSAQRPQLIYVPHEAESHLDHQACIPILRSAVRKAQISTQLRAYEVWTPMERFGWPEDITPVMARKLRAVRCYRSQLAVFRYDRAIRGLNQYRGCLAARTRFAEVFRYES